MTAPHRCDPLSGGQGGPVTLSRVLRILLARIDGLDDDATVQVIHEFAGCARCLAVALLVMAGAAVGWMPDRVNTAAALTFQLASALDQIEADR